MVSLYQVMYVMGKKEERKVKENARKLEKFIEDSKEVHGDKYDYSESEYEGCEKEVKIICPTHGPFWQLPYVHKRGCGCPKCNGVLHKRMSLAEFIFKAREVHGDKYDYSKVVYKNTRTKVCIVCPIHGEFWMTPLSHLYGRQGCPKCAGKGLSTDEVIARFRDVHGDEYDYSKFEFTRMKDKSVIICRKHGEFLQSAEKHIYGRGCPKCAKERIGDLYRKTTEQFIEEARGVHGDKYDYSKVEYVTAHDKVCITCPTHGDFWQRPYDHLHGHGCALCNESMLERTVSSLLSEKGIEFIPQCGRSVFAWLGGLSLDFYLPRYNVAIECQGGQHFAPIEHFGGIDNYNDTVERDNRKRALCEENGVRLIYFTNIDGTEGCITSESRLLEEATSEGASACP